MRRFISRKSNMAKKYPPEYYDLQAMIESPWFQYFVKRIDPEIQQLKDNILKIDFTWNWNEKSYTKQDLMKVWYTVLIKVTTTPALLLETFKIDITDLDQRLNAVEEDEFKD